MVERNGKIMTNIQLKKALKKLGMAVVLIIFVMIGLSVYTLGSTKAELSIYENAEYEKNLQALGIEEEEFKEYLSLAGYLSQNDGYEECLNMATSFMDTLCSSYEPEMAEDGTKSYDFNIINDILKEIIGDYIKGDGKENEYYKFDKEANLYVKNKELEEIPYCLEIKEISKNDNTIEVTYDLAFMTPKERTEYIANQNIDVDKHTMKAIIMCNTDYTYSKYFISQIEEVEK